MRSWSFYDEKTGLFVGRTYASPDDSTLAQHTPPGLKAMEGVHDHLSKAVNLSSGKVIEHQPPKPSEEHEWNAGTRRWQLTKEAQKRIAIRTSILGQIAHLEGGQHRTMREATLGDQGAMRRLVEIEQKIIDLRKQL